MENLKGTYKCDFICDGIEGVADVNYDYNWFAKDSKEFNFDLARFCAVMTVLGYDTPSETEEITATGFKNQQPNLERALREIGLTDVEINGCAERDQISYFTARRELELDGKMYNFVLTAFMGSYKRQWFSNFDPLGVDREANGGNGYAGFEEKGKVHLGFADARDYMYQQLTAYLDKYPSEYETKVLIIGHSRGAAAANLLAVKLFKLGGFGSHKIKPENIFTYCLATPNAIVTSEIDDNPDYDRIINILNPEDFVTMVFPAKCGFSKFGRFFRLMGSDNRGLGDYADMKRDMQQYYSKFVKDREFHPFKKGNTTAEKVIDIMGDNITGFDTFYNSKMRECFKTVTPYEYFKYTLCAYIAGGRNEEEIAQANKAMYLLLASAVDLLGTTKVLRKTSGFFVFQEGLGGATGGKIGATYFGDSHRPDSYASFLLSIDENRLIENSAK